MKKQIMILTLIITFILGCLLPGSHTNASKTKPRFIKKYDRLTVGKHVRFTLLHVKKTYRVVYTSSNKKIASIGKKSGRCTGNKPGKVTIYAKIYNKKNRKICTLKNTLTVKKSSLLPNASFHLKQSINPYNYTIKLECSRILLRKEVKKSRLILRKKGSTFSFSAPFSNLSNNGKEITYTLTPSSQKKLSPKNGSMNGTYTVSSSLFHKKINLSYEERIGNYSLSGYVLSIDGNPVNQAYVKCITKDSVKTCYTDSHGYYRLQKVKNPSCLTVAKKGYFTEVLTSLNTSVDTTSCENIFLHRIKENNFSAQFHVSEQNGTAIDHASVYLLPSQAGSTFSKEDILFSGETDYQGNILFYTNNIPNASPCTKWTIGKQESLTCQNNFTTSTNHKKKIPSLSIEKTYHLYIGKSPGENTPGYGFRKFTFCPKDYISEQFYFDIKLPQKHPMNLENLSIIWDNTNLKHCTKLQLSFYQKGSQKPILDTELGEEYFITNNKILSFTNPLPYSLPDDTYYLRVKIKDNENKVISFSPITKLYFINGSCIPKKIACSPISYSRALVYGDFIQENTTVSFQRYQWIDGQYFYLDTLTTSLFQGAEKDIKTANLLLPYTEVDTSYQLLSHKGTIIMDHPISFFAEKDAIYTQKDTALNSPPITKISCVHTSDRYLPEISAQQDTDKISLSVISHFTAAKSYIRSNPTYPNSVTVFYKKEGTFLSASLTVKPSIHLCTLKNNFTVMDIFTNNEPLFTTQSSYH